MSELPRGWAETTFAEISEIKLGKMLDKEKNKGRLRPYLRNVNVRWDQVALDDILEMRFTDDELEPFGIRDGDLLVCEGGEPGRCAVWQHGPTELKFQKALMRLRSRGDVEATLLAKVLRLMAQNGDLQRHFTGTTIKHLPQSALAAIPVRLPPLAEQKRIVAKLDALNAKSARARTELARIETLVSRYKQAVLSKAFAIGVGELNSPITAIGDIADVTKGASPKWQGFDYQESGIRFIRSQNVGWGELLLDDEAFLDQRFNLKQRNSVIEENDVLLNIVGASIGRSAVADTRLVGANCNQAVALVKPKKRVRASSDYLCYWFQSPIAQGAIRDGSVDVARANFSLGEIKKLTLPWPSNEQQQEIVRRIESAFAKIDRLAKEAKRALELVGRLDEAILAKAFRGELVSQDENDEPAEHLLARIRTEREAAPKGKRRRGAKG